MSSMIMFATIRKIYTNTFQQKLKINKTSDFLLKITVRAFGIQLSQDPIQKTNRKKRKDLRRMSLWGTSGLKMKIFKNKLIHQY